MAPGRGAGRYIAFGVKLEGGGKSKGCVKGRRWVGHVGNRGMSVTV